MDNYLQDMLGGYAERWHRLAIFNPLFSLKNKKNIEIKEGVDWFTLGFLTLLFFFECKVQRKKQQGYQELAEFLFILVESSNERSFKEYYKIAHELIDHFRNASGKKERETFFNWETGELEEFQYNLLKTDSFEIESNRQYFTLTEEGLSLIFATKEYYSEFRISISQLLIRKQLQIGQFSSALHEIHELRVSVREIQERIDQLKLEISRNIISENIRQKYLKIIDSSYEQLKLEDEQFRELYDFAKTSRDILLNADENKEKTRQIAEILEELSDIHQFHRTLLGNVMELKNYALKAARETLFLFGIDRFNFDQELVSPIVTEPLGLDKVAGLVQPFLPLGWQRQWSLLDILFKQRLIKHAQEEKEDDYYIEIDEEQIESEEKEMDKQSDNFLYLLKMVLEQMQDRAEMKISEMDWPPFILDNRSFYDFCLLLHQESPLGIHSKSHRLLGKAAGLLEGIELEVIEQDMVLSLTDRYRLQDLLFCKKEI